MLTKVVQGAEQKLAGRDGIEGFMLNVLEELNGVDLNAILNGLLLTDNPLPEWNLHCFLLRHQNLYFCVHKITAKLLKQGFQKLWSKEGIKELKKLNLKNGPISMTQKDSTKWTTSKNFPKEIEFFNKRILNSRNQIPIFLTFPFSDWNSVIQMKLKFIFLCLMDKRQNERRRKGKFSTCPSTAEQEHNTFSLILSN